MNKQNNTGQKGASGAGQKAQSSTGGSASRPVDLSVWKRCISLLDSHERRLAWLVLSVVVASAISAAVMVGSILPFLSVLSDPSRIQSVPQLAWAYDTFGFTSEYRFIMALGGGTIAMIVVANAMQMLRVYVVSRFTLMRIHSISHRLLAHYLYQPYDFFLGASINDLSARVLHETGQVVGSFLRPAAEVISAAITLALVLVVVIWVDPVIAVLAIGFLGAIFLLSFALSSRKLTALGKERNSSNKARFKVANEALLGIKDIKLLDSEPVFLSRYSRHSLRMADAGINKSVLTQLPPFLIQTAVFSGVIIICLVMLNAVSANPGAVMTELVPTLGVMALAAQRLLPELSRLYSNIGLLRYGAAAVDAVYEGLQDGTVELGQLSPDDTPLPLRQGLQLDGLGYRYPGAESAGLKDITLHIKAGERVGIVGTSGSGKTTLADILLGLLIPNSGEIRVDDVAVTKEKLTSWRNAVGYVPQDIYLLDASVAENIAFGIAPGKIDRARVEAAAELAQLGTFVRNDLKQGYDTPVGERGQRLSGGQRQRIGIARALYRDADLIVFDEATSALDNVTEKEVMAAIDGLPGDKTIVMIAHRLSTVRGCDKIVVLDKGQVAGFDTWDRLSEDNAVFQDLLRHGQDEQNAFNA